jgi:ferritin-like metal-binding protein YciE
MTAKTLEELFLFHLKDVYSAENQILKALPKMAKRASAPALREAFETHFKETETQVERLNEVFQTLGMKASAEKCAAMEGIVEEAEEVIGEAKDPAVLDAGMIAAAQAVEHYEIARYGTLTAWAEQMGNERVSQLLRETLQEEKHADEVLNKIAMETVNRMAA